MSDLLVRTLTFPGGSLTLDASELDWLHAPIEVVQLVRDLAEMIDRLNADDSPAVETPRTAPSGKNAVTCADCGRAFGSAHALRLHRAKSHGERSTEPKVANRRVPAEAGPFACDDCGQEFPTKQGRAGHRRWAHREKPAPAPPAPAATPAEPTTKPAFPDTGPIGKLPPPRRAEDTGPAPHIVRHHSPGGFVS